MFARSIGAAPNTPLVLEVKKGSVRMATFIMFGKYSMEATKAVSAKRTKQAMSLFKQNGGELKAAYALLGDIDLMLVVDLPNTESAMKTSAALSKLQGISFSTAPAVTAEDFDKLIG